MFQSMHFIFSGYNLGIMLFNISKKSFSQAAIFFTQEQKVKSVKFWHEAICWITVWSLVVCSMSDHRMNQKYWDCKACRGYREYYCKWHPKMNSRSKFHPNQTIVKYWKTGTGWGSCLGVGSSLEGHKCKWYPLLNLRGKFYPTQITGKCS